MKNSILARKVMLQQSHRAEGNSWADQLPSAAIWNSQHHQCLVKNSTSKRGEDYPVLIFPSFLIYMGRYLSVEVLLGLLVLVVYFRTCPNSSCKARERVLKT